MSDMDDILAEIANRVKPQKQPKPAKTPLLTYLILLAIAGCAIAIALGR